MLIRKLTTFLFFLGFFLTLGYWSGRTTSVKAREVILSFWSSSHLKTLESQYPLPQTNKPSTLSNQNSSLAGSYTNGYDTPIQQSILVIGVSDFAEKQPYLISLWMAMYLTDRPHVIFMPIFPSFLAQGNHNDSLQKIFNLNANHEPAQNFLYALRQNNLQWDNYVVVDRVAITSIVNLVTSSTGSPPDQELQNMLFDDSDSQLMKLSNQTRLLQSLCATVSRLPFLPDVSSLYNLIPTHAISNLEIKPFISDWQIRLAQGSPLTCEFPFLTTP